jgi:hypothetical protein
MSRIFLGKTLPGKTERLAGVSPNDSVHLSTPRAAVKGVEIRPNRSVIQGFIFHARSQDVGSVCFVLNAADDARRWERHFDADVELPGSGADGQDSRGT